MRLSPVRATPDWRRVQSCQAQGYTPQQLSDVQQLDCAAAVAAVEGNGGGGTGTGGGGGGSSGSGGTDCFGCQHDGTSCITIAPGGGAYSQCDPSCC